MAKEMLRNSAIAVSKMKLVEEWAKLKCEYKQYERNPYTHPMYAKEWKIFYLRTLADITAGNENSLILSFTVIMYLNWNNFIYALATANEDPNTFDFTTHWEEYWKKRIQVYHNKSRQKVIEEIAANYEGAASSSDSDSPSSDERYKTSRSTSSASTYTTVFDLTGDGSGKNARSNGWYKSVSA